MILTLSCKAECLAMLPISDAIQYPNAAAVHSIAVESLFRALQCHQVLMSFVMPIQLVTSIVMPNESVVGYSYYLVVR